MVKSCLFAYIFLLCVVYHSSIYITKVVSLVILGPFVLLPHFLYNRSVLIRQKALEQDPKNERYEAHEIDPEMPAEQRRMERLQRIPMESPSIQLQSSARIRRNQIMSRDDEDEGEVNAESPRFGGQSARNRDSMHALNDPYSVSIRIVDPDMVDPIPEEEEEKIDA